MSANEHDALELHLANCADCRRNAALMFAEKREETEIFTAPEALKETVKNLPPQKSHLETNSASAAFDPLAWLKKNRLQIAFASVLIFCFGLVGFYVLQDRQTPDDVLRNGAANKNSLKLLAPEDDANVSGEKIEFRWSPVPNAKTYTLILSDEKGDIIREISTEKTNLESSISELGLMTDKRYFWHVKAKFTDGSVAESDTKRFSSKK